MTFTITEIFFNSSITKYNKLLLNISKLNRDKITFMSALRKFLVKNTVCSTDEFLSHCDVNWHLTIFNCVFYFISKNFYELSNLLIILWIVYTPMECILYNLVVHRFYICNCTFPIHMTLDYILINNLMH